MKGSIGELFRPVATTAIAYALLLVLGFAIQLASAYWGTWFSLILILWQVSYLLKLSEGTRRFTKHEVLPAFTTWGMAALLQQPLDYALGLVAVVVLAARLFELYG